MEIKSEQFAAQLDRLIPRLRALLFYGPDSGLVTELATAACRSLLGGEDNPFRLAELTSRQLREDPALLADEAAALSFTGGRRVLRLRDAGNDVAPQLASFLKDLPGDALLVVEAGDLPKRSALVQAFLRPSEQVAAVPCYHDEGGSLLRLAETLLREAGLAIEPDALTLLSSQLGGDRQLSRRELEKLILYKGSGRIVSDDVAALIGDGAALDLDDLAMAVAEGDLAKTDRVLSRSLQQGIPPVQVLRQVQRHFQRLQFVAGQLAEGTSPQVAMKRLQPPPFWKIAKRFEAQARRWSASSLASAGARLLAAEAACKRTGARDHVLCAQALLAVAGSAPKSRR